MTESELRDRIAQDITILEPGLCLLKKEQYIPHSVGTRSFIDLYAKDFEGHHVLIELKRSNASAREALHEIHKYVEAVKDHLGARDDEIRVVVASTEWEELMVPFSRLSAETDLAMSGLQLQICETTGEISVSSVAILPMSRGRFIAPWHDVNWYFDRVSLDRGLESIDRCCGQKGIGDYITVVLRVTRPLHSEHQAKMWAMIAQAGEMTGLGPPRDAPQLPTYEYIAYFAMQALTKHQYLSVLERDVDQKNDAIETIEGMDDDEALGYLHELVTALDPRPHEDHFEIGYAAKLGIFIDTDGLEVECIRRRGVFTRNTLLTDEEILSELRGEDGATRQRFKRTLTVANRAHMASARTAISECLDQNPVWKGHVLRALDEIEHDFPMGRIDISIFNPATGMMTPYLVTTKGEDGILYLPTYHLIVSNPEPIRMYFGALEANGSPLSFKQLLNKYYDGNLHGLLFTMTWGGYECRDADIVEDLGAAYRSFRCDGRGANQEFFAFRDDRWRKWHSVNLFSLADEYFEKNEQLVKTIVRKLQPRNMGGLFDASSSELELDSIMDLERGLKEQKYFVNPPDNCDICGCTLPEERYMIDCRVKDVGAGACLCPDCYRAHGEDIGWGVGQLYLRHDHRWLLVSGFGPTERS